MARHRCFIMLCGMIFQQYFLVTTTKPFLQFSSVKTSPFISSSISPCINLTIYSLSFPLCDRFSFLVGYEYDHRRTNKFECLIKQATFNDPTAAVEHIEYHPDRKLEMNLILELATGNYMQ